MEIKVPMVLGYKAKDATKILSKEGCEFIIKETKATIRKDFVKSTDSRVLRVRQLKDRCIEIIIG